MKWPWQKRQEDSHPAQKLLQQMLQHEKSIRASTLALQNQVNDIKNILAQDKNPQRFQIALDRLHSRFNTYRPLRTLLREFTRVWKAHHQLIALERKKQLPAALVVHFAAINRALSVELNQEHVFANTLVRDLSRQGELEGDLEELLEKVHQNYVPTNEKRVAAALDRIQTELAALIGVLNTIVETLENEEKIVAPSLTRRAA